MAEIGTLTLTEFLTARLDEDEAVVQFTLESRREFIRDGEEPTTDDPWDWEDERLSRLRHHDEYQIVVVSPARVLAEVAAKRRIVEEHRTETIASLERATWAQPFDVCYRCGAGGARIVAPCPTLRALASVYSDHPD